MYIPYQQPPKNQNYPYQSASQNRPTDQYQFSSPPPNYAPSQYPQYTQSLNIETKPPQYDPYTYNFHNKTTQPPLKQFSSQKYQFDNQRKPQKSQGNETLQNKSFLDGFDNNASAVLNKDKSFARNLKGRLFNNGEPSAERAKEEKMREYREQLQRQMMADKQRKQKEKKEIEQEQLQRQRRFYEEFKIEAQVSKKQNKNQNPYIMMRTHQKIKKSSPTHQKNPQNSPNKESENVDIITGQKKGRVNRRPQSKLNNPEENFHTRAKQKNKEFQENMIREREIEEERIAKILLFQRNVLQKLSDIKQQIRATDNILDTSAELEKVRNSLRARNNFKMFNDDLRKSGMRQKNAVSNNSQYYSLPKKSNRAIFPPVGPRYNLKLNDLKKKQTTIYGDNNPQNVIEALEENAQSRITNNERGVGQKLINDKNVIGEQGEEQVQES